MGGYQEFVHATDDDEAIGNTKDCFGFFQDSGADASARQNLSPRAVDFEGMQHGIHGQCQ